MKRWLMIVALLQLAMVILDALQFIDALQPALWIARWSLGLPGSILGQWTAERWLWHSGASMREIGICGLVIAVIFNMALAWAIARLFRSTRRALRRKD